MWAVDGVGGVQGEDQAMHDMLWMCMATYTKEGCTGQERPEFLALLFSFPCIVWVGSSMATYIT